MTLHGCHRDIKYVVFIFNFFFWLIGTAIFSLGVCIRCDVELKNEIFRPNDMFSVHSEAYTLITIGAVVMFISFFACIGSLLENQCMLAVFFAFMFVIFSVLLTGGILTYVSTHSVSETVDRVLQSAVREYENVTASKLLVDFIHYKFNCCGAVSGPVSDDVTPQPYRWTAGCQQEDFTPCIRRAVDYYTSVERIIAAVLFTIACTALLGIILSIALCLAVREQQHLKLQQQQQHPASQDADDVDNSSMKTNSGHERLESSTE